MKTLRNMIVYARAWIEIYKPNGADSSALIDAIAEVANLDKKQTEEVIAAQLGDDWKAHLDWSLRIVSGEPSLNCSLRDALQKYC